jgi:uncharacterized membrane protein HdeD (DUF308 family)
MPVAAALKEESAVAIVLATRWWTLALRGIAAIVFGILTFISPASSLLALVILFGAYAIVDGVLALILAIRRPVEGRHWGSLLVEGIAGIVSGVLTFAWPGLSALVLLYLIAAWAVITGVAEIAAAIRLRKQVQGEWLLALTGVLSIVFGILLFVFPGAGALAVTLWIGAYAVAFGILLLVLALRLRAWGRQTSRHIPVERAPSPA